MLKKFFLPATIILFFITFIFCFKISSSTTTIQKKDIKIPILMYHHLVTTEELQKRPELPNKYSVISQEKFLKQMQYLYKNDFNCIDLQELANFINNNADIPENPIVITFDDGYESNYKLAFPILKKYNQKATINIIVKPSCENVKVNFSHLNWEQMYEMKNSGLISIQSHTYDLHKYLPVDNNGNTGPSAISRLWLHNENRTETYQEYIYRIKHDFKISKEIIENKLDNKVNILCFPFGACSKTAIETAQEIGYSIFLTTKPGYNTSNTSLKKLMRFNISEHTTMNDFIKIVTN